MYYCSIAISRHKLKLVSRFVMKKASGALFLGVPDYLRQSHSNDISNASDRDRYNISLARTGPHFMIHFTVVASRVVA